jgi:hypothetical protein
MPIQLMPIQLMPIQQISARKAPSNRLEVHFKLG